VSHCGLAIYIKKYLKAKEELKYFTMQKYNLQKNPVKETKVLQHIRDIHKVRKRQHQCPEFGHRQGEIQKKPAKNYIQHFVVSFSISY
jgi:hypothetical protein